MTSFSEIDLTAEDLDWFGIDAGGELGHFASAGKFLLPTRVIQSREDLENAYDYFSKLPGVGRALAAPEVEKWWSGWISEKGKTNSFEAFGWWSEKGLYSFDCLLSTHRGGPYYMVTYPETPLSEANLPGPIARYLDEFRFPFRFRDLFRRGLHVEGEDLSLVDPPS